MGALVHYWACESVAGLGGKKAALWAVAKAVVLAESWADCSGA